MLRQQNVIAYAVVLLACAVPLVLPLLAKSRPSRVSWLVLAAFATFHALWVIIFVPSFGHSEKQFYLWMVLPLVYALWLGLAVRVFLLDPGFSNVSRLRVSLAGLAALPLVLSVLMWCWVLTG